MLHGSLPLLLLSHFQLCPTLSDPMDGRQPTRLPVPGILQARALEWAAWPSPISHQCGLVSLLVQHSWAVPSHLYQVCARSCPTLVTLRTGPTSLLCPWNFTGKNTRVGCYFPLPDPGIKLHFLHLLHWQVGSSPLKPPRKPWVPKSSWYYVIFKGYPSYETWHFSDQKSAVWSTRTV